MEQNAAPTHPPSRGAAFYVVGATATGKSELAVKVAERCNGEIVGADAFQVYAGLDILTAKPPASLLSEARHHLIGEIPLSASFDLSPYVAAAAARLERIRARGKIPLVVGGTGLYVRGLVRGLDALPPADPALRRELAALPLGELQARLAQLDAVAAQQIDLDNPRRVTRALEVCVLSGRPFSSFRQSWSHEPSDVAGVNLVLPREQLYARINRRTEKMFEAGVVDEVRTAGDIGPTAQQAIGLREIRELLAGTISAPQCITAIQQSTRRYAKRQMTWFRRESAFETVDAAEVADIDRLADELAAKATRLSANVGATS